MKRAGVGLFVAWWLLSMGQAQTAPCPAADQRRQLQQQLQALLEEFVAGDADLPSALLHVEAPRLCLSFSGASGSQLIGGGSAVEPHSTFRIASNTKTYTAAAILRLVEQRHLQLSDPISVHLPSQQLELLRQGGYQPEEITILHLLTHTGGLYDHGASGTYLEKILADPGREWTRLDQLRIAVEDGRPLGGAGEVFSYSDTGYVLLGGIVERKTGLNLGQAFRKLLDFARLELTHTWMEKMESPPAGVSARVHQYLGPRDTHSWDPSMDLYGGGGLVTSARDLAAFVRALFEGRVFESAATFERMLNTQPVANRRNYRVGLYALEVDGQTGWGHTGFWNTFAFHFPELDVTVAGSVNQQQTRGATRLAAEAVRTVTAAGRDGIN